MAVPNASKSRLGGNKRGANEPNPLLDNEEHTDPVSSLKDVRVDGDDLAAPRSLSLVTDSPPAAPSSDVMALEVPATGGSGPMSEVEQDHLRICESSIDDLRLAFAKAGRALQIIRDGRLYRGHYKNFDDYVEQRWNMQRSYANKLVRAWPLAEQLRPHAPALNEGQVRELLPVAAEHGDKAAVIVYRAIAESGGVKVTASLLRDAVAVLPRDRFDEQAVIERINSLLRGEVTPKQITSDSNLFEKAGSRIDALTKKVVEQTTEDPDGARAFAAKLRTLAEQIESGLG